MRKDQAAFPSDQPALVVTYGNTSRKHRPLGRDVTVLGRAPGCDVVLVSPEVAPVHCIIARVAGGWRLRDCTGRSSTRVNGQGVSEVELSDGDVLQVGTFSFQVRLPGARAAPAAVPGAQGAPSGPGVRRLEQSRRNLAQLALRLRRRLRVAESALRTQEEVDQQADRLRALQREIDTRRRQQEQAEAGFRAEQEAFEQELAGRRRQVEEVEARLRAERLQLEERARRLQQAEKRAAEAPSQGSPAPTAAQEELERRAEELEQRSRALTRRHLLVQEQAQELAREQEAFRHEREAAAAEDQREADRLRLQLEVLEAEAADLKRHFEVQQAELTTLRALEEAQATVVELSGGGAGAHALIAYLRQQICDRDRLLEEMKQRLTRHSDDPDPENDGYEAELNRYRLELEKDRRELNEQLAQLQERHAEMEEAARETELQMARERAQIAREQAELNRLRNELSLVQNRSPRERTLQERLAAVRQLKEDSREKEGEDTPGQPGGERSRWRRLFGLTSDAPAST
jgi:pSer/pThr/pTyr-binding forkhead associated (FHA) protein